ncbi:MAG TPA: hypothetical protein VGV93_07450, partial [Acidimicrobiales bacterium]|nr:hypothetical protein [Acidimicrobiales bacterium]
MTGRVISSETSVGIPGLVVSLKVGGDGGARGRVVASTRTDRRGSFAIEVEDGLGDLTAAVTGVEDAPEATPLATGTVGSGVEELVIALGDRPSVAAPQLAAELAERERIAREADEEYSLVAIGVERAAVVEELRERRQLASRTRKKFQSFLSALSSVPEDVRQSNRFVRSDESVREVSAKAMEEQLVGVV